MSSNAGDASDRPPLTIERFCHRQGISRSFYFTLKKAGLGPAEIRIGKLVRIDRDAERAWKAKMSTGAGADFRTPTSEQKERGGEDRDRSSKKRKKRDR